MKTLGDYLKDSHANGIIDHSIRANVSEDGKVTFYIHPDGKDGDTCDYLVDGNSLQPDPSVSEG